MKIQKLFSGLFSDIPEKSNNYLRYRGSNKLVHRAEAEKMMGRVIEFNRHSSRIKRTAPKVFEKKKTGVWEIF
jgi:hypothetical protein